MILQNDKLVSNYTVYDLLFFGFIDVVDVLCLVELRLTAIVPFLTLQNLVDAHIFFTACVFIL